MAWTLAQLAEHVGGTVHGDSACVINSVAAIQNARPGQISFLTNAQYKPQLKATNASAIILKEEFLAECPVSAIVTANPHAAYARIAQLLHPAKRAVPGIHSTAIVDSSVSVGENVSIGPYVVIEANSRIGDNTSVGARSYIGSDVTIGYDTMIDVNVTIHHGTYIGNRCILYSGTVIGSDGFGHAYDKEGWVKIPQIGKVFIGNDVEVGANTTIDRGAIENTIIEDGVKLDNQIQIAHNVRIGEQTVLAACTGVAGSAIIGKRCMIGGLCGIAGHLEITDGVLLTGMSTVTKSIKTPGTYSSTMPVEPTNEWRRFVARFKLLDNFAKRLKALEKIVKTDGN